MRQEERLKEKFGTDPGFKVPEGYFEELNARIMNNLPEYPEAPKAMDLSLWQRVKPYVYLAAMFAGIWLMMNMFHRMSSAPELSLDNPPAAIAAMMQSYGEDSYPVFSDDDYELQTGIIDSYGSIDEFEEDFGYDFKPEFANMKFGEDVNGGSSNHEKPV